MTMQEFLTKAEQGTAMVIDDLNQALTIPKRDGETATLALIAMLNDLREQAMKLRNAIARIS